MNHYTLAKQNLSFKSKEEIKLAKGIKKSSGISKDKVLKRMRDYKIVIPNIILGQEIILIQN